MELSCWLLLNHDPPTLPTPAPCPPHGAALTVGGLHGGRVGGSTALHEGVADEVGEEGQAGQQGAHGCGGRAGTRLSPSGRCPRSPQCRSCPSAPVSPSRLERYRLCASRSRCRHSEAAAVLDRRQSAGRQQAGLKRGALPCQPRGQHGGMLCAPAAGWDSARFGER